MSPSRLAVLTSEVGIVSCQKIPKFRLVFSGGTVPNGQLWEVESYQQAPSLCVGPTTLALKTINRPQEMIQGTQTAKLGEGLVCEPSLQYAAHALL